MPAVGVLPFSMRRDTMALTCQVSPDTIPPMPSRRRSIADRFWPKVRKTDSCWIWTASTRNNGYGALGNVFGRRGEYAHRLAWMLANGPILPGLLVCHTCDNKLCVRPSHLFLGTYGDNMRDCVAKGRHVSNLPPQPRGEKAYMAKLTQAEVDEIKRMRASGMSGMKIATIFSKVRYQQIYRICSGERWKVR